MTSAATLAALGVSAADRLGFGGEAVVYALDAERVARVHHAGTPRRDVDARCELARELARHAAAVPFAIPELFETRALGDHVVTIERRLPGRPLDALLSESTGSAREALLRNYLDAVARIGDLAIRRPWFGDLTGPCPVRAATFRSYLEARARVSLVEARDAFSHVDAHALAAALPEPSAADATLVHLDAFLGNVLGDGERVSAVLDFGGTAIFGDRRLDPLTAVAYLEPPIAAVATDADRAVARAWLAEHGLEAWLAPARRWAAAFWTRAADDPKVWSFCKRVLGEP